MAEELTQEEKDALAAAEAKKRKEQEDTTIPKARFDEVNEAKKKAEEQLAKYEAEKKAEAEKKLAEEGKYKELLAAREAENAKLKLDVLKRDLVQEAVSAGKLHARLAKMVVGNTEEEIKASLQEATSYYEDLKKELKDGKLATDTGVGSGKNDDEKVMSAQEWMELERKDPKAADDYLKKITEARQHKA